MDKKQPTVAAMSFAIVSVLTSGCGKMDLPAAGPPAVEVVEVTQRDVPITKDWVATLDGFVNAQIRAQVAGLLLKQTYADGAYVAKGTLMFEIDPRPFQAALDQASANLEQTNANLQRAQAELGKTEMDVARYTPLAKESAISQQELDDAVQANLASKAQVAQARSAIEGARAAVESAKLDLGFTKIVSPVNGVAAISTAQVGDLVGPQSGTLTTVSTLDPIIAAIAPSEQEYLRIVSQVVKSRESGDSLLRKLEWQLKLADGTMFPYKGRFYAIDRQIDVRTGAIQVKIQFPNPGNALRPGGFATVGTITRIQQNAILIPQRAVNEIQGGYVVAVIDQNNKAIIKSVTMGQKVGGWWIVNEGLKPGERVVAEGIQEVQDGELVNPQPYKKSVPLAAELNDVSTKD
jgi:membrane fusion protein (multidrug efflux system)